MMDNPSFFWLVLTLLFIVAEAFYSSMEMAIVSMNKVRLQYYVSQGNKRARWINWLLEHPSRLFGTTLIGVNTAMLIGSECSRHLYDSLNLHPYYAPATQVLLVLVFAELAPIFAARRHPEHMSMAGSPVIYASAKVLTPIIWIITLIARFTNWILGGKDVKASGLISREELKMILEARDLQPTDRAEARTLNALAYNIFTLRDKKAVDAMVALSHIRLLPSNATVGHMRHVLEDTDASFMPIFHREPTNVIGIAFVRDLVKIGDPQRVRDCARSPWFITQTTGLMHILQQFRRNNEKVAVVLNDQGRATGILTLDDVVEEIFGPFAVSRQRLGKQQPKVAIDKVFPGTMQIQEFNRQFHVQLESQGMKTLAELIEHNIGHHPEVGESISVGPFLLSVEEATLLEIKSVRVQTR